MSGTLFVVATPIGNLEDITLRALRVLREADVIAAEDTRRTAKLLNHHGIGTRMQSFHEHNTRTRIPQLIRQLSGGAKVALVTDAGTPGVSDPGVELVAACREAGIRIEPLPGASAPLVAAVGSGFALESLTILGFVPAKAKDRSRFVRSVAELSGTVAFFETPHRLQATLGEMATMLGDRPIVLGRELTKAHEEFVRGTAREVAVRVPHPRGEFTIVVGPQDVPVADAERPTDAAVVDMFGQLTDKPGVTRREAITAVARHYRMTSREVYLIIEQKRSSVERPS
jgi:16S rRNA (cytidine1402-2'-O)-methyltransferase